jgi:hypothetical protein
VTGQEKRIIRRDRRVTQKKRERKKTKIEEGE